MGLSKRKSRQTNIDILRNQLEDIVLKDSSLEAVPTNRDTSAEIKKSVDHIMEGTGVKRSRGRKKNDVLIDGHLLLTV